MFFTEDMKHNSTLRFNAFKSGDAPGSVHLSVHKGTTNSLSFWLTPEVADQLAAGLQKARDGGHSDVLVDTDQKDGKKVEFHAFPSGDVPGTTYANFEKESVPLPVWMSHSDVDKLVEEVLDAVLTVEETYPKKEEQAMTLKHQNAEAVEITYAQLREWAKEDYRFKEFFEEHFNAPVFEEDHELLLFRHIYRDGSTYYLVASADHSDVSRYVLTDISRNYGNRYGDADTLENLSLRANGWQHIGLATQSLMEDIYNGRGIPSQGSVGPGGDGTKYTHSGDEVFRTNYRMLRRLGSGCEDVQDWLEENIPGVYEEEEPELPKSHPLIFVYYPEEPGENLGETLMVTNGSPEGWDANTPYNSIPESIKEKLDSFSGGKTGWWMNRKDKAEGALEDLFSQFGKF